MRISLSLLLLKALAVAACLSAFSPTRAAESPVVLAAKLDAIAVGRQIAVLEDPRGELSFTDVQQRSDQFRPAPDASDRGVNFGYSRSVWWLKLELQRTPDTPANWMLELAFPQLDRVDFFGPNGTRYTAGDTFPTALRPVWHRHFVFPLDFRQAAPPSEPLAVPAVGDPNSQTAYLRIASEGILVVPITLWQEAAFHRDTQITMSC